EQGARQGRRCRLDDERSIKGRIADLQVLGPEYLQERLPDPFGQDVERARRAAPEVDGDPGVRGAVPASGVKLDPRIPTADPESHPHPAEESSLVDDAADSRRDALERPEHAV